MTSLSLVLCSILSVILYHLGKWSVKRLSGNAHPKSLLHTYGIYLVLLTVMPILLGLFFTNILGFDAVLLGEKISIQPFILIILGVLGFLYAWSRIKPDFRAHKKLERMVRVSLFTASAIAILVTFLIFISMVIEATRFFQMVPITDFLFGVQWRPESGTGSLGSHFGAMPLFLGTTLIMLISLGIAVPFGVLSAVYMVFYASKTMRHFLRPMLEILAGIPSIVYGFFAIILISPSLRSLGEILGLDIASESALGAGLVMGVMILPFVSSLVDDVLTALPDNLRQGSLALGATSAETICRVILPAGAPGIVAAVLLAMSRAIGETMLVVMALGLSANMTANPLKSVTTVTVQIVSLLTGDQAFDSPGSLSAFALGLTLFMLTLFLNMVALKVVRWYKEKYD